MIFFRPKNWQPITILAFLSAGVFIPGCQKAAPTAPPPRPPPMVTAAPVTIQNIPIYIDEIGKSVAPEVVSVQPQVSGKIMAIHFKDGVDLKKGDKLFTIDPRPFQAQLDQARADLALNEASLAQSEATLNQYQAQIEQVNAEWAQSKSRLDLNKMEFERAKSLLETNAVSKQEYDTKQMAIQIGEGQVKASGAAIAVVQAQARQSTAAVAMVQAHIKSSQAAIETAEINLEYTTIVSPIDGRAGQRLVDTGNVVNATIGTQLLVIQRLDPIYTDFTIPERELSKVRQAMAAGQLKVECWTPEEADKPHSGVVTFLDNAVMGSTGTVKLRATLANSDRFFWPGQFVKVRLILGTKANAVLIPASATQIGQAGTFVYVLKADSTAEQRPVTLGQRYGDLVAIDEGLAAGDNVILTGQLMVFPTAKVTVQDSSAKVTVQDAEKR